MIVPGVLLMYAIRSNGSFRRTYGNFRDARASGYKMKIFMYLL